MTQLTYSYQALDRAGAKQRGSISAASSGDAYRRLAASGLTPVEIREAGAGGFKLRLGPRGKKIQPADIAHISHQLAVLLEARIPIVECFRGIGEQQQNPRLGQLLLDIAARLQGGTSLTAAIEPHRATFGDIYVETLRAAERSGNLIQVLNHLAESLEEAQELRRATRAAFIYPVTVMVALAVATLFLLMFVVPRFARMFAERGVDLPLLTRLLMGVGEGLRSYWYLGFLAAIGTWVFSRSLRVSPHARLLVDRWLGQTPVFGRLIAGIGISRFAAVFGLSLSSGLGLIECLDMGGRASGRPMIAADAQRMIQQVRQGGRLSVMLHSCESVPAFARQLLCAGEESAELSRMCRIISRHYQRDAAHLAKTASALIEPMLIAGLTGVVLLVALAIFLPMWDMVSLVG